jgi:enoyl-CoA hydratase/carnithine racemase
VTQPVLLSELRDGVLLLTWNRPERNNGWTYDLELAYFDALRDAAVNPEVRAIVVTGAGRSFCPGLDMNTLSAATDGVDIDQVLTSRPHTFARQIPKPTIAAVNGACAGIGFVQALCCDIRFAARGARFTTAFARRGLPAENSLAWMLPRLVGTGVATDLLLSARVIEADEAQQLGLVNQVVAAADLLPTALAYAADLAANCSPLSMATIKQQLRDDWDRNQDTSRVVALKLVSQLSRRDDFREGIRSFVEKRTPDFAGLSADPDAQP